MIALIQRVSRARVRVEGEVIGEIGSGLLALVCAQREDVERDADALAERVLDYRVFGDADGRMNLNLRAVGGGLLAVPQFTLAADTAGGLRPSFTPAAAPDAAKRLFDRYVERSRALHPAVATGRFGARMEVELTNDGPVTFWLQTRGRPG